MRDFAAIATQYAHDVVDGRIPAGRFVRLAAQRHLNDLQRQGQADFPYVWNPELPDPHDAAKTYRPAQRIVAFIECLPHIKGDWAAQGLTIRAEPWQCFFLCSVFGWVHRDTGKRRFRSADLYVPRKNAKSTLAAGIGLYMLAVDGEFGAEVYSGATSKDQALEVFKPALVMTRISQAYRRKFGVEPAASSITVPRSNGKFVPLIGKPGDGASPSCAVVDEYHEHKSPELYDTMATGMGARSQPLLLVITTAGANIGGPAYMHQVELQKILEGSVVDETRWGIVYGIDPEDDWTTIAAAIKANPNFGVSVRAEFIEAQLRAALSDPRKQNVYKTKHCNVWVGAASPWVNVEKLQRLGDPTLKAEEFRADDCWEGADLASKVDIAAKCKVFRRLVDGQWHYYAFYRNWLPEAAVMKEENAHYQAWVNAGHITQTPGNMIDLGHITDDIRADADLHVVQEVALDAWGSREIAPTLQADGFSVIDVPMVTRNLSEPMKLIAGLIDGGRFHHDGNPAVVWMFSNVECVPDRNENIFPRKARAELKIDAAVATILAVGRAMLGQVDDTDDGWVNLNSGSASTAPTAATAKA